MFAAVEFARTRNKRDVAMVSMLWLVDDNTYCYWPTSLGKATSYEDLVKNQPIYQKHWKKYAVTRVLRTSNNYQDIDSYVIDLLQEGTTEDEGQTIEVSKKHVPWEADPNGNVSDEKNRDSGEMKKSAENESAKNKPDQYRKNDESRSRSDRGKTQDANDSSSGPDIIDNSDSESQCENNSDLDQQSIDKRQRRPDVGSSQSARQAPRNEDDIVLDQQSIDKRQRRPDVGSSRSARQAPRNEDDIDSDQQSIDKRQRRPDVGSSQSARQAPCNEDDIDLDQQSIDKRQRRPDVGTPRSARQVPRNENDIDLDQQSIDKRQRRPDVGSSRSARQAPRNEDDIDLNRKKTKKKHGPDTETPQSVRHLSLRDHDSDWDQHRANKKLQPDTGTPRSTNYESHSQNKTDLNQQRTNKSKHMSVGTPRFSASKHDDDNLHPNTLVVNHQILSVAEFQEVVLKYMEEGKVREEQNQQLLTEISLSLKASIRGAEKPDKVPDLPITDYHVFEKFDTDLTDPIINKYIKNRLIAIGGVEVRAVSMGMLKCVMSDHLALQFNWQGQNQKKSFQSTNLQVLICDTTKQFFNKKIRATDKEIKSAIQDWLKQASNRIKSRSKKNTET